MITLVLFCVLWGNVWGNRECDNEDIRIVNGTLRIIEETYLVAGGLQVCRGRAWATVCYSGWDDNDATVACRQLGMEYRGGKIKLF